MIIDAFMLLIYGFIYAITSPFRLAPIVSLPVSWTESVATAGHYALSLNYFLPITTLLGIFAVFLAYEAGYFGVKLINWVIRKIPGIS